MRPISRASIILLLLVMVSACGAEADTSGVVIDTGEDQLLISQNLSPDQYEKIKHVPVSEMKANEESRQGIPLNLMVVTYKDARDFQRGDYVEVWLEGEVMLSYPSQAKAKKVKAINEE